MADTFRPYGGSSKQRLTDLINAANGKSLIEGIDFEYGPLEELTKHPKHNTQITLISKKPGVANTKVSFNRLGIDILAHLPPEMLGEIVIHTFPFSVRRFIHRFNDALGLDLKADEVENYIYQERRETYPLRIKRGASVAWLPSEINVRARYENISSPGGGEEIPVELKLLSLVWPLTQLDGLYPPS
jgi:hypothetical protein